MHLGDVSEENGSSGEDNSLLVDDIKLLRDGCGHKTRAQYDSSSLGCEAG